MIGMRRGRKEKGKRRKRGEKDKSPSQTLPTSLRAHVQRGGDSLSLRALSQWWFLQPQPWGLLLHLPSEPHWAPLPDQRRPLCLW